MNEQGKVMKKSAIWKFRRFLLYVILGVMNAAFFPLICYAAGNIQGAAADDRLELFVPVPANEITEAYVQIGNSSKIEADVQDINASDSVISTLILFDNSLSISEENRTKMREITKGLVESMQPRERITLCTFDTDRHLVVENSQDKTALTTAVDAISFNNQDTYLKDVLYSTLKEIGPAAQKTFRRIIVLSDGSDDNDVGYTYEEIYNLIDQTECQVTAVGSRYEKNIDALEKMFSISRRNNSPYILMDDVEDTAAAVTQVNSQMPYSIAQVVIPEEMRDGSSKNVRLTVETAEGASEYPLVVEMPFNDSAQQETARSAAAEMVTEAAANTEKLTEEGDETESETEAEILPPWESENAEGNDATAGKDKLAALSDVRVISLMAAAVAVIVLAIILTRLRKKKASGSPVSDRRSEDSVEDDAGMETLRNAADTDPDATELRQDDITADQNDDDERTVLVNPGTGDSSPEEVFVKLEDMRNPDRVYSSLITDEIMIGRSSECDIVIPEDKAIGRKHCMIVRMDGRYYLRDNNSSNGTVLNGQKVTGVVEISSGDQLEIGRSRLSVRIVRLR